MSASGKVRFWGGFLGVVLGVEGAAGRIGERRVITWMVVHILELLAPAGSAAVFGFHVSPR